MTHPTPSNLMPRPKIPHRLHRLCLTVEREIRKKAPGFCWIDVMERRRCIASQAFRVIVSVVAHDLGYSYPKIGACFNSGHVTAIDAVHKYKGRKYRVEVLAVVDVVVKALAPAKGEE